MELDPVRAFDRQHNQVGLYGESKRVKPCGGFWPERAVPLTGWPGDPSFPGGPEPPELTAVLSEGRPGRPGGPGGPGGPGSPCIKNKNNINPSGHIFPLKSSVPQNTTQSRFWFFSPESIPSQGIQRPPCLQMSERIIRFFLESGGETRGSRVLICHGVELTDLNPVPGGPGGPGGPLGPGSPSPRSPCRNHSH